RIIEMYDPLTRVLVGRVGPAGFAVGQAAPAELFPVEGLNLKFGGGHALAFTSAVYWLELDQRRVREVFKATREDPVISATEVREYASDGKLVRSEVLAPLEGGGEVRKPRTAVFGFIYPLAGLPIHRPWLVDYIFEVDTLGHRALFLGCLFAGSLLSAIGSLL